MSNSVLDRIKELTDLALGGATDEVVASNSKTQALLSPETGNSGNKVPETRSKLPQKAFPIAPENWEQTGTLAGTAAAKSAPDTSAVGTAETDKRWDPGTATLIKWFLDTTPPAQPFELQQAVVIARPGKYWEYLRQDIAAGPQRARGKTGAFQENLRQLYRVLHDGKDIGGGTA